MELVFFLLLALVSVIAAVAMILQRNPVYSVLYLIVVMGCLAGLFLLLESEFIAALQVIVYAGAIMVLFLFVIMLLNLGRETGSENVLRYQRLLGPGLAAFFFLLLGLGLRQAVESSALTDMLPAEGTPMATVEQLSRALYTDYILPVELASVLLLAAMIGAVAIAKRGEEQAGGKVSR